MNIQIIGLNHKTAPIEVRERISIRPETIPGALSALKSCGCIQEALILSTCNRTEIYAVAENNPQGLISIRSFISDFHKIALNAFEGHLYSFSGKDAIRHLFRVASSLDSMIVGETQIFGQVKDAYFAARQYNAAGRCLSCLFEEAIRVGKKVRTDTQIGKGAVSTTTAAIELSRKIFETLENKKVLIIGAGKIGELTVKNLNSRGVKTVMVANRTFARAEELARIFCGEAIKFEGISAALKNTDIVISSTSAPHFVLNKEDIIAAMRSRKSEPLFIIDLGLPRNIDPQVNGIDNVYLYNIDDLAQVADANIKDRRKEAAKAEAIIDLCVESAVKRLNEINEQKESILK